MVLLAICRVWCMPLAYYSEPLQRLDCRDVQDFTCLGSGWEEGHGDWPWISECADAEQDAFWWQWICFKADLVWEGPTNSQAASTRFWPQVLASTPGLQELATKELTFEDFKKQSMTYILPKTPGEATPVPPPPAPTQVSYAEFGKMWLGQNRIKMLADTKIS